MSLVLKQEGQRRLRRVWSETSRQVKATGLSRPRRHLVANGRRSRHLRTCACPSAGTCWVSLGSISGVAVARDWVPRSGPAARTSGKKSGRTTRH